MYFIVYKTTNIVNGKVYIGCHKTKNLNDGYMGSGKIIGRAIKKYGIDNFKREIIAVFDKSSDMYEMESFLVNEDFISSNDTYNIKLGGKGGFDYINDHSLNIDISQQRQNSPEIIKIASESGNNRKRELLSSDMYWKDELSAKLSNGAKKYYINGGVNGFTGKKHTDDTKRKIGDKNSKHQLGEKNSNYGNCWVYCPYTHENKSIPRNDLSDWESRGWVKGRRIK